MMRFRGTTDKAGYFKSTNNTNSTTMTEKKISLSSIDAFLERDIIVEVPEGAGEELATEKAMAGEGEVIRERIYGVEAEMVNAEVSEADSPKATFEVMGVFLDTKDLQPFTREVGAQGPEEALARALAEVEGIGGEKAQQEYVDKALGSNLAIQASNANVRPVSIRRTSVVTDRTEYLHEIDSFS